MAKFVDATLNEEEFVNGGGVFVVGPCILAISQRYVCESQVNDERIEQTHTFSLGLSS